MMLFVSTWYGIVAALGVATIRPSKDLAGRSRNSGIWYGGCSAPS